MESELYFICGECGITCDESEVDYRDDSAFCPNCGVSGEEFFHPYDEDEFNEKYGF